MIFAIVALLSFVQSIFGVGLLLFGTPIMLLLGLTYREALWVLLPASLTISTLQLVLDRGIDMKLVRSFATWALPGLFLGLAISLGAAIKIRIDLAVAALLLFAAALRLTPSIRDAIRDEIVRRERPMLVLIGLIHGLTNMGGSLLSIYASTRFREKKPLRQNVAMGYTIFAISQLTVLFLTQTGALNPNIPVFMITACVIFLGLGRAGFSRLNHGRYQDLFSVFEVCCGLFLGLRSFGFIR